MTLPNWLTVALRWAVTVAVPLALIVTPLYVFVHPAYVNYQYRLPGFPPSQRFSPEERIRLSDTLVGYLRGRASLAEMRALRTDDGDVAMRPEEVEHMADVKTVTDAFYAAHAVAAVVLVLGAALLLLSGAGGAALGLAIRRGVWLTAALMGLVLLSSLVDFSQFFTRFHQMFFQAGSWLFYEEDTLIQLYPLVFWSDTVLKLGLTIVAEAALLYAVSAVLMRAQPQGLPGR